jgi:hypothetical protein
LKDEPFLCPAILDEKRTPFDKAYGITMTPTLIKGKEHKISSDIPNVKTTKTQGVHIGTHPSPERKNVCHFGACSVDSFI